MTINVSISLPGTQLEEKKWNIFLLSSSTYMYVFITLPEYRNYSVASLLSSGLKTTILYLYVDLVETGVNLTQGDKNY